MTNKIDGDSKIIYYYAPLPEKAKVSDFDKKLLELIKEFGICSTNDLFHRLKPDYKAKQGISRLEAMKLVWANTKVVGNIAISIKKLKQIGCVRVNT